MTMLTDRVDGASPQEGDRLYTVTLTIPQIGAQTHDEAAEVFADIFRNTNLVCRLEVTVIDEEGSVFDKDTTKIVEVRIP